MQDNILTKIDFIVGSIIAILMIILFSVVGGLPLVITFVPGVAFSWIAFFYMYKNKIKLPNLTAFMPFFFLVLGWQFLHFNEEFMTDFKTKFPILYGSEAYSSTKFVGINMVSYFVFTVSCVLFLMTKLRFMLIPVLFYITYGAIGNAIAHTWWSIKLWDYFPGLFTAQLYWFLGPWILYKLIPNKKFIGVYTIGFAVVLIPLLTFFMK